MKSILSLFSLFTMLLLSATSFAQTVCPHCGGIHQSPPVSTSATYATSANKAQFYSPMLPANNFINDITFPSNVNFAGNVNVSNNIGSTGNAQALAQQKASLAASTMNKGHVGGSLGPATHEGVGFSTSSSQQAIDAACYSGSPISAQGPGRPRIGTGVARGSDGWYACLLCL